MITAKAEVSDAPIVYSSEYTNQSAQITVANDNNEIRDAHEKCNYASLPNRMVFHTRSWR